nr:hypothetical protein [Rhodococcus sp. DK17]
MCGELVCPDDVAVALGVAHQGCDLSSRRIRNGIGAEKVSLEGVDHLRAVRAGEDPLRDRAIVTGEQMPTGLDGSRDRADTALQQRPEPSGVEGGSQHVTVPGQCSVERRPGDPVHQQLSVLGSDMNAGLGHHLLSMGRRHRPPHQPVVIDELGQSLSGSDPFDLEPRCGGRRADDRLGVSRHSRHSLILVSRMFKNRTLSRT